MKFSAMPYSRPDLEAMKANLTACTEAFLAAESAQEQIALRASMTGVLSHSILKQ